MLESAIKKSNFHYLSLLCDPKYFDKNKDAIKQGINLKYGKDNPILMRIIRNDSMSDDANIVDNRKAWLKLYLDISDKSQVLIEKDAIVQTVSYCNDKIFKEKDEKYKEYRTMIEEYAKKYNIPTLVKIQHLFPQDM